MAKETAEKHAVHDLLSVKEFRDELRNVRPCYENIPLITASQLELAAYRERQDYVTRQSSIVSSLAMYEPLFTWRMQLCRPGDKFCIYFSPIGVEFAPVTAGDGDDVLVSWAHPGFLGIRNLSLGQSGTLSRGLTVTWTLVAKTELGREDRDRALFDLKVIAAELGETLFKVVRFDEKGRPVALVEDIAPAARVAEPVPGAEEIREPAELRLAEFGIAEARELKPKPRLALDTIVKNKDGQPTAIPFALDPAQWEALTRYASAETIVLTGPPGTGKTTVALLRATTLIHSTFEYADDGKRLSDRPKVDLRKHNFRVFVVTEHLRGYLKEFLSSSELGLPEAQVVNLRGAFLENFVRHKTLSTWIRGLRFRLSKAKNRISDALSYVKSLPYTLRLCFYHAVLNAQERAGEGSQDFVQRIYDRVYHAIESNALDRVLSNAERERLRREEQSESFDLDAFLERLGQKKAFDEYFSPRDTAVRQALPQLRDFVNNWLRRATERCDRAIDAVDEIWLTPRANDLLLSRFVEDLSAFQDRGRERNIFIREAWRELVHLVDPKEVLLRVIADFESTGDMNTLHESGLTREDALGSLAEWRDILEGVGAGAGVEEEDEDEAVDTEEDEGAGEQDGDLVRRRGSVTRTDFPLLAAIARVFLALPPEAKQFPDKYQGVGFLLPDDLPRYDHIIIDEAQDFTYAEVHLVRSLVETERQAVTISGDPFQRMDWRSGFSSLETIRVSDERRFHITKNYRQTVELAEWVRHLGDVLYGASSLTIESAHEHGPRAKIVVEPAFGRIVRTAAGSLRDWYADDRNPFAAALLIGLPDGTLTRFTNRLSDELEVDAIHAEKVQDGRQIERGTVAVATIPTVKGLEFDGVVVVVSEETCDLLSGDSPQAKIAKNMLYVACSRAKRNLTIILPRDVEMLRMEGVY